MRTHCASGVVVGLLLVFRTNISWTRYDEGWSCLGRIRMHVLNLVTQSCAYIRGTESKIIPAPTLHKPCPFFLPSCRILTLSPRLQVCAFFSRHHIQSTCDTRVVDVDSKVRVGPAAKDIHSEVRLEGEWVGCKK